jgi:hypothetical protein
VLICVRIPAILGRVHFILLSHILFVKKCEQMSIWFDFCELKFNTISIVRAEINDNITEVDFYLFFIIIMLLVLLND